MLVIVGKIVCINTMFVGLNLIWGNNKVLFGTKRGVKLCNVSVSVKFSEERCTKYFDIKFHISTPLYAWIQRQTIFNIWNVFLI